MSSLIKYEIINKVDNPEKIVIGLHGWSGNEHSLKPVTIGIQSNVIMWHLLRAPYKIQRSKGYSWNLKSHEEQNVDEQSIRIISSHIEFRTEDSCKGASSICKCLYSSNKSCNSSFLI